MKLCDRLYAGDVGRYGIAFQALLSVGSVLFLLGVALSLANGHIQITYYLVLLCLLIYVGYAVRKIKEKAYGEWLKTP